MRIYFIARMDQDGTIEHLEETTGYYTERGKRSAQAVVDRLNRASMDAYQAELDTYIEDFKSNKVPKSEPQPPKVSYKLMTLRRNVHEV